MNRNRKTAILILVLVTMAGFGAPAAGQDVGVTFDEDGTVDGHPPNQPVPLVVGNAFEVYVVAYGLAQISGYEFLMTPSYAPNFFLGKTLYGLAPQDFGSEFEVRAGTGGCVSDPTMMGPSATSWTLCRYDLLYFIPANDVYFCLSASPGSGANTPQFALCDEHATLVPLLPGNVDPCGIVPDGCAVANNTNICWIPSESPSWGSIKAQYK